MQSITVADGSNEDVKSWEDVEESLTKKYDSLKIASMEGKFFFFRTVKRVKKLKFEQASERRGLCIYPIGRK